MISNFNRFIFKKKKEKVLNIYLSKFSDKKTKIFCKDFKKIFPNSNVILISFNDIKFVTQVYLDKDSVIIVLYSEKKKKKINFSIRSSKNGFEFHFIVKNICSIDNVRFTGNSSRWAKTILSLDKHFHTVPHLRLIKPLLIELVESKINHVKSEAYFENLISFFFYNSRIWFRNYQIKFYKKNNKNLIKFIEIGPRFSFSLKKAKDKFGNPMILNQIKIK